MLKLQTAPAFANAGSKMSFQQKKALNMSNKDISD